MITMWPNNSHFHICNSLMDEPDELAIFQFRIQKNGAEIDVVPLHSNKDDRRSKSLKTTYSWIIGRKAEKCDYVVSHATVSRQHAEIQVHHDRRTIAIRDLKSSHGTKVNGQTLSPQQWTPLSAQDELCFGSSSRVFILEEKGRRSQGWSDDRDGLGTSTGSTRIVDPEKTLTLEETTPADLDHEAAAAPVLDVVDESIFPVSREFFFPGHDKSVTALALDPSGARFATGSLDYHVRLYDFAGLKQQQQRHRTSASQSFRQCTIQDGHGIVALSYSASGHQFLACSGSSQPKVLSREGLELIHCIKGDMYLHNASLTQGHTHYVTDGHYSKTSKSHMITSSLDGTIRVWDPEHGKLALLNNKLINDRVISVKGARAQKTSVTSCCYAPGHHSMIYCSTGDGQVYGFDLRKQSRPLRPEVAFSNDGSAASSSSSITRLSMAPNGLYLGVRSRTTIGGDDHGQVALWDCRMMKKKKNNTECLVRWTNISTEYDTSNVSFNAQSSICCVAASRPAVLEFYSTVQGSSSNTNTPPLYRHALTRSGSSLAAVQCIWSSVLNQILVGQSDGQTRLLYSPEFSHKGILLTATKKKALSSSSSSSSRSRHMFARIDTQASGVIHCPNALKMYRDEIHANVNGSTTTTSDHKRKYSHIRKDAKLSKMPEQPLTGPGVNGKLSTSVNFTQHFMQSHVKSNDFRTEDPREAILKYAEEAQADPKFMGLAYAKSVGKDMKLDPRYALASRSLEQEQLDEQKQEQDALLHN